MKYNLPKYRDDVTEARVRSKLSQVEIASKLGISRSSWQKYEYGVRTPESKELREAIRDLLGIPVEAWEGGRTRRRPTQCKAS